MARMTRAGKGGMWTLYLSRILIFGTESIRNIQISKALKTFHLDNVAFLPRHRNRGLQLRYIQNCLPGPPSLSGRPTSKGNHPAHPRLPADITPVPPCTPTTRQSRLPLHCSRLPRRRPVKHISTGLPQDNYGKRYARPSRQNQHH